MNGEAYLASAKERINQIRSTDITLRLIDEAGTPLANLPVNVQLTKHAFKFGANAFLACSIPDQHLQQAYHDQFAALFNYATLPFYWRAYESAPGKTRAAQLQTMADWCAEHHITPKGHPLVWHMVYPQWARDLPDDVVITQLEDRVRDIVQRFKGSVDIWDVVNEATVAHRLDHAISKWAIKHGATKIVEQALHWAHEANPQAKLLYNDFNISDEFENLVRDLLDRGAPLDVIGIQSHMHQEPWSLERVWNVCETYKRFGLPLHFTELTILSGQLKAKDDDDWHTRRSGWKSLPEQEAEQAKYGEALYTLLFSHPAVEAITWWDFSDYLAWQGAPSGLLREDMSPKPLYVRLLQRIQGDWRTDVRTISDENGVVRCRCFFGEHEVTAKLPSNITLTGAFIAERQTEGAPKEPTRDVHLHTP